MDTTNTGLNARINKLMVVANAITMAVKVPETFLTILTDNGLPDVDKDHIILGLSSTNTRKQAIERLILTGFDILNGMIRGVNSDLSTMSSSGVEFRDNVVVPDDAIKTADTLLVSLLRNEEGTHEYMYRVLSNKLNRETGMSVTAKLRTATNIAKYKPQESVVDEQIRYFDLLTQTNNQLTVLGAKTPAIRAILPSHVQQVTDGSLFSRIIDNELLDTTEDTGVWTAPSLIALLDEVRDMDVSDTGIREYMTFTTALIRNIATIVEDLSAHNISPDHYATSIKRIGTSLPDAISMDIWVLNSDVNRSSILASKYREVSAFVTELSGILTPTSLVTS